MRQQIRVGVLVAFALACLGVAQDKPATTNNDFRVRRGKYLVERVCTCGDCHTPFDQKGEPIADKMLMGSPIIFKPTVPVPAWAAVAPQIAGLPGWSEADAVNFFMTGKGPNNFTAQPPMPQLRFNRADAIAVTAYLKSLAPKTPSGQQ